MYLVNPYSEYWSFAKREPYDLAVEFSGVMISCFISVEVCVVVAKTLNKFLPWEKNTAYRAFAQLALNIALIIALQHLMRYLVIYFFFGNVAIEELARDTSIINRLDRWRYTLVSLAITVLLNVAVNGSYFITRWRNSMIEAADLKLHIAELKEIAMRAELQSLKLQLDPHFMFNNFSTLSELISEDKNLALSFIDNLTKVYRYMILNIHYNIISLQKELRFIQSYSYLITIRHGENVVVSIDVPDVHMEKQIPPITVQLLIENAIKHNIASEKQPLHISIFVDDDNHLIVTNNLQRIAGSDLHSSKLGVKNIKERYRLVSGREPEFIELPDKFCVRLPLLD
jgi:sensor histidine kinase YesM